MSTSKCPFAFALGIPGQGFHAQRIFGYALNDTLATIILASITSLLIKVSLITSIIGWFVLGEVLHYVYGTQTAFLTTLGIRACP